MSQYATREPGYSTNNPDDTQKHLDNKKGDRNREGKIFYNIIKGHKVTDLTRPNELGTTTSKVATKILNRTQLWKQLRAPSHNTAEDNQPRYSVVFRGRTQYIQDGYQQHNGTTRTRRSS
jgi:hypothetical protein